MELTEHIEYLRSKVELLKLEHYGDDEPFYVVPFSKFDEWKDAKEMMLAYYIDAKLDVLDELSEKRIENTQCKLVKINLDDLAYGQTRPFELERWKKQVTEGVTPVLLTYFAEGNIILHFLSDGLFEACLSQQVKEIWALVACYDPESNAGFFDLKGYYANRPAPYIKEQSDPDKTSALLTNGAFFKANPTKVLGTAFETTNQFNRPVTKIKGDVQDVVERIEFDAPEQEVPTEPLETEIKPTVPELFMDDESLANIRKVIADYNTRKHEREAAQKAQVVHEDFQEHDLFEFREIIGKYNSELTEDEIKAWVWYQQRSGGYNDPYHVMRKDSGWSAYVIERANQEKQLQEWLKSGVMCFYDGNYLPAVLYYAENIYQRLQKLKAEKEVITERFGQEQYDRQLKGLEDVRPERLTLTDPVEENRLAIKAISDLTEEIAVTRLTDGTQFSDRSSRVGDYSQGVRTLREAFVHWIQNLPNDEFKRSTWLEIVSYYLKNGSPGRRYDKAERLRKKQNAKDEGEKLFARFLFEALVPEDQKHIEELWNARYNGYVPVNYFKVPVGFSCSATFKNKPLFVRPAQREGIGFLSVHGSGCIAYDVGVGKTMTGILSIAQAMESGQCKRPFIVVPNQTYKNWLSEISGVMNRKGEVLTTGILPHYGVNDLYNLSAPYLDKLRNKHGVIEPVPEYSISVITYEGMRKIGFGEDTWNELEIELFAILNQGEDGAREESALNERIAELMGRGVKGSEVEIEDLGFDFMLADEAHAMKKIFVQVKGESDGEGQRQNSRYQIKSGQPSSIALKGFMLAQYVLRNNRDKNVVLLTATPFTNNPLEIYSMLALIGYNRLERSSITSLQGFFNTYIKTSMSLVINAKMKPERKEVVLGFQNLVALQKLIFGFIDYKSGEDANIQRPNKWVLPLTHKQVDGEAVALPVEEQISTNLPMTATQRELMDQLELYVTGEMEFSDFCSNTSGLEEESDSEDPGGELLNEASMSDDEEEGTRVLRGVTLGRQIALSPYLFSCTRVAPGRLEPKQFIDSSPKLKYTMECIRTVKEYHESKGEEMSGQVIYMNAGVDYFPLIHQYLIDEIGFEDSEVDTIKGGMNAKKKENIKDKFLSGKVKVLIGSQAIKEGINLQNRATVLYNLWLDWNPTDLKQLEGRIWRFGNQFANVRIVIPLVEDSIDTAIFQKLEEKTSRINEIWQRAGKENTLKLDEFNPAELKMGLITNPSVLAEITLMEEREVIQDEVVGLENQLNELADIVNARDTFQKHIGHIQDSVAKYKPLKEDQPKRKTATVLKLFKDFVEDPDSTSTYSDRYTYDEARKAHYQLERATERILQPRGLDIHFNKQVVMSKIEQEIQEAKERLEMKTGDEAQEKLTQEIIEERERTGYQPKSIEERVKEFASLNDQLLSEHMRYENAKVSEEREKKIELNDDREESEATLIELEQMLADMQEADRLLSELEALGQAA